MNKITMKNKSSLVRFDWAIKRLLRQKSNFVVLEGLLSTLLGEDVVIVRILESEDKFNPVDVLAENDKGELVIIKVQNNRELDYFHRMLYGRSKTVTEYIGSPDKSGGKFFNSIENLHLCTMNNQGLLALAQLILPSEILSNFEVVRVEEEASLIRIYLDESVKAEYKENPEIESKGFCEAVTIRDFPIRDKGVDLIVRRRKWYDKQNNRYFSDSYDLKAEETRYSKEFAAFLKGVYGDDSYDLPFA